MNRKELTEEEVTEDNTGKREEDRVEIVYYTDPLCCWSWAFEPQWRRLRYEFSGKIRWRYRMGGLLPDWNSYNDPMNAVSRPLQMGPVWMEARYVSGMPIQDRIWYEDPPTSSYPACIAVKCAELQSVEVGEQYLRCIREAVMLEGRNIAKNEVLIDEAVKLAQKLPQVFDAAQFENDLKQGAGREAFRQDLQKVRYYQIGRFPTLTLQRPSQPGVMITGYRPYSVLLDALSRVAPDLKPVQQASDAEAYKNYWGQATEREVSEALTHGENYQS